MILSLITDAISAIGEWIQKVLIALVAGIFHIVNYVYQIFLTLAKGTLLDSDIYNTFVEKMYTILGVVMLFVLAYNILLYIVDPDKKESTQSAQKVLTNLVTSVILIIVSPYIFNFAFQIQAAVLNNNSIGSFFTGNEGNGSSIEDGGKMMAIDTFSPFFTPVDGSDGSSTMNESTVPSGDEGLDCSSEGSCSLKAVKDNARQTGSFKLFKSFAKNISDSESANPVDYDWFLALIAGVFLCYVIISFCFDLGIRVFKLAFCQIIAPVAIMCRVIPKQEDIFNKWLKVTTDTFLSVFIRVFVMNFGVYFIGLLEDNKILSDLFANTSEPHAPNRLFVLAFLIMGLVAFIRSAPKLISDLFGFGSGDLKLGIKDKLKAGGAFTAGAALGGSVESIKSNIARARRNGKVGIGSAIAGGISGGLHGFSKGRSAASVNEMRRAAQEGALISANNRDRRSERNDRYKTMYPSDKYSSIKGRFADIKADLKDWATDGAAAYEVDTKKGQEFKQLYDDVKSGATKLRDKFRTDAALVGEVPPEWKNKQLSAEMNTVFADLSRLNGGKAWSLADLDQYIQQEEQRAVNRDDFYENVFDEAGYSNAIKNAISNGVPPETINKELYTTRRFNNEKYQTEIFNHSHRMTVLSNMQKELEDKANDKIINSINTGIGTIGKEKMLEVGAATENYVNAYKLSGSTIVDKTTGETFREINQDNLAESLKNISDAAEHNAVDARRKAAIYEKNKAARQQDKK